MASSNLAETYYRESMQAICELVTQDTADTPVPACPGWNAKDVVAHLTGALQDFLNRNTSGAPSPEWTATHIERFRDTELNTIKSAWLEAVDSAGGIFRHLGVQILPDVVTHEFDIRGAMGNTEDRDAERLGAATDVLMDWANQSFEAKDLPTLSIRLNRNTRVLGGDTSNTELVSTVFEISRVLTGRRSESQIRGMEWSGDPTPWIPHITLLGKRTEDLIE